MPFKADKPYNELPPLPPNQELETRAVLKKCITARAALAELKQAIDFHGDFINEECIAITSVLTLQSSSV